MSTLIAVRPMPVIAPVLFLGVWLTLAISGQSWFHDPADNTCRYVGTSQWHTLVGQAMLATDGKRPVAAERYFRAALKSIEGDDRQLERYATTEESLANLLNGQGRFGEEQALLQHALRTRVSLNGKEEFYTRNCMDRLAYSYCIEAKYAEALSVYETTLTGHRISSGMQLSSISSEGDRDIIRHLLNLAFLYTEAAQYAKADLILKHCLPIVKAFDSEGDMFACGLGTQGELFRRQGKYAEAEPPLKRALNIHEYWTAINDGRRPSKRCVFANIAFTQDNLGQLYQSEGRLDKAKDYYTAALNTATEYLGPNSPQATEYRRHCASLPKTVRGS
jgi:tetratricopeptide (TPR) repeat protein